MTISIKKADNGYIIRHFDDELGKETNVVIEQRDNSEEEEIETFRSMLWELNEIMGPSTSRYSAKRISITTIPGDKHPDSDKEEEVHECI